MYMYTYTYTHTHTHTCTHVHTHTHTHIYIYIYIYIYTHTRTYISTYTHRYTHTQINIIYIYIYIYIDISTYNWKRLQIQVFLGWQQPRHKWRWCAPGWEVGRQSVWHQTSVGQNHVDQITSRGGCPHGIVCLCPSNRIGGVHKGCILRQPANCHLRTTR